MHKKNRSKDRPAHLVGLTDAELRNYAHEVIATREAVSTPLPGPLASAFAGAGRKVGDTVVRCPVAIDFAVLQRLDSPLLKQMAEAGKPKELRQPTTFSDGDGYAMVYQFTTPVEEMEAAANIGKEHFYKLAKKKVGMTMNPFVVNKLVAVIGELFAESFVTALKYTDGEGGKDFPAPSAEAATASAGGSTTSA